MGQANVQNPENAMAMPQVEIEIIHVKKICLKEKLVIPKSAPFTRNGQNGHHVLPLAEAGIKREPGCVYSRFAKLSLMLMLGGPFQNMSWIPLT